MARILFTWPAREDLVAAAKYIAEKAGNSSAALRFLESIDERLSTYADHPQLGEACHD